MFDELLRIVTSVLNVGVGRSDLLTTTESTCGTVEGVPGRDGRRTVRKAFRFRRRATDARRARGPGRSGDRSCGCGGSGLGSKLSVFDDISSSVILGVTRLADHLPVSRRSRFTALLSAKHVDFDYV